MRFLLTSSFIFCFCSSVFLKLNDLETERFERQTGKGSSALQQVTNDLSILARLVNGIALQDGFSDGSTLPDDVIAEFLNIASGDTLRKVMDIHVDTSGISLKLENMLSDVSKLGDNPLTDSSQVKEGIKALDSMKNDVEDLKKGSTPNLAMSFINETEKYTLFSVYYPLVTFSDLEKLAEHFKDFRNTSLIKDARTAVKYDNGFRKIDEMKAFLLQMVKNFINYKTEFKKYLEIGDKYKVLNPIFKISKAAQAYKKSKKVFSSLSTKMKLLKKDSEAFQPLINEHQLHLSINDALKPVTELVKTLFSPKLSDNVFIEGLPNGPSDLSKINNDLKGTWLKETIADGMDMGKLESYLKKIENFSEKLSKLHDRMNEFRSSKNSDTLLTEMSSVFESLANDGKLLKESKDLEGSVNNVANVMTNLKEINGLPAFEEFDKFYDHVKNISELAESFQKAFEKMFENGSSDVEKACESLISVVIKEIPKTSIVISEAVDAVDEINKIAGFDRLANIFIIAAEKLKPLLSGEFSRFVTSTPSGNSVVSVQKSLEGTGLLEALGKLKDSNINLNSIDKMLNYGRAARTIKKENIESLKSILVTIDKLKAGIRNAKDTLPLKSRRRRDSGGEVKKLKDSKSLSKDLGRGVNILQKLATVFDKRSHLITASEYPFEVNRVISDLPALQSTWTRENQKAIKEFSAELENLEKYAEGNKDEKDLMKIGTIFNKASEIKGVPIDTKLFEDLVVPALEASTSSTVKQAATTFSELSKLELDYSKHSTSIKAASLTLLPLREYFDDIFGIKRISNGLTIQNQVIEKEVSGGISGTTLIIIISIIVVFGLIVIGFVYIACKCRKHRKYFRLLNDPETWIHLAYTRENEPVEFGNGYCIEAYSNIIRNNFEAFKKCLKNGAYVDAKVQSDKQANTMLHEAVIQGKANYVEALIRHGASRDILNHEYETPFQLAVRLKKKSCIKMFKKYEKKTFKVVLPEPLSKHNYLIEVDKKIPTEEHYHGDFFKKFGQYQVRHQKRPTHYVVKTDKKGVLHVSEHLLPIIFSATMIMDHRWLKACLDNSSNIGNNKQYRVTKMKFRGKEYNSLLEIKDFINRMDVPYMFGIGVSYNNNTLIPEWLTMRKVTVQLGVFDGSGDLPITNQKKGHTYHRDDLPRNFLLYRPSDKFMVERNYKDHWIKNPLFNFMDTDEFIHYLLCFEINSEKIMKVEKKNKKNRIAKKIEKQKGKKRVESEETNSGPENSDGVSSAMTSANTPNSRTPTSRTPTSMTPTSRTPGKTRSRNQSSSQ